jgi:hypothetical protein
MGYNVTNDLRVKVRKLDHLGAILDDVVGQGANNIHGINFSVADPKPLQDEARKKAMANARRKAELYAAEGGVKLGRVLLLEEQPIRLPQPLNFGLARAAAPAAVPVAAGEQDFTPALPSPTQSSKRLWGPCMVFRGAKDGTVVETARRISLQGGFCEQRPTRACLALDFADCPGAGG